MRFKPDKKKIAVLFLTVLVIVGCFFANKHYGPGWKSLTLPGTEWEMKQLDDGRTIEFSTTFFLGDVSELDNFFIMTGGTQVLQVLINHQVVMDQNPYSYYPTNESLEKLDIRIHYNIQPHYLNQDLARKYLKKGYNSLRIFTTTEGLLNIKTDEWRLVAESSSFSTKYRNYQRREGFKWKESENIHTLILDIPGNIIPDDPKVPGKAILRLDGKEILTSRIKMETRGRSSQAFDKKQFSLRFIDENREKSFVSIAHMPPGSDFVLYGPYMDLSQIRNSLAYSLFEAMGHYAPRSIPVELIINNNFRGLYFLIEKVIAQPGRVDIRYEAQDTSNIRNSAFLVQVNPASDDDVILYPSKLSFVMEDPSTDFKNTYSYESRITDQLGVITRAMTNQIPNLDEAIDFSSFADFMIVNEVAKNIDAYRLSTFFYKTHEDDDPRMFAGPVWDFNLAFGNAEEGRGNKVDGWLFLQPEIIDTFWVKLFEHPKFHPYLVERYETLRTGILSEESILNRIDSLVTLIQPVLENNFERFGWPIDKFWPYETVPANYEEEISRMKLWIRGRLEWMDGEL